MKVSEQNECYKEVMNLSEANKMSLLPLLKTKHGHFDNCYKIFILLIKFLFHSSCVLHDLVNSFMTCLTIA